MQTKWTVIGCGVCAAVVAGVWMRSGHGSGEPFAAVGQVHSWKDVSHDDLASERLRSIRAAAQTGAAERLRMPSSSAAALADAAAEGLALYTLGTYQDARSWMNGQGLHMHSSMTDPVTAASTWDTYTQCFRGASFYPETAIWVKVVDRGKPVQEPVPVVLHGNYVGTRAYQDPGAIDVVATKSDAYELRVDADLFTVGDRTPFKATVGLAFVQRPLSRQWILNGVSLYNVPHEYAVTLPPF